MKIRAAIVFCLLTQFLTTSCKTPQHPDAAEPEKISLDTFNTLDWQRQAEYLETITRKNRVREDNEIIAAAITDDDSAVIVVALDTILRLELDDFLPQAIGLLNSEDVITRWKALLVVESLNSDDAVLPSVVKLTGDKEWLVREAAYRTLRRFKAERKAKNYFYTVLFHLNEKNPQVVAEIYRTLVWYDDETAWPYMMKRSYHCKSASELILVMRELARTKTREAQVRLKTLTRSQSVIVRQEANELLREYF